MKKILPLTLALALLLSLLAGCACNHQWREAACDTPKTCSLCGTAEGTAPGHQWTDATCTAPKTCTVCHKTEGSPLSHDWQGGSCETPNTCTLCGAADTAPGHQWTEATCTAPKTCSVCSATEGSPSDHDWKYATTAAPKTCRGCGITEGDPISTDPRFQTEECESLFGTWIFRESSFLEVFIFANDGTLLTYEGGYGTTEWVYYVQDTTLYLAESWDSEFDTVEIAFANDQVIMDFGESIAYDRYSDSMLLQGPDGRFDPSAGQDLLGTWRQTIEDTYEITILYGFAGDGKLHMTLSMSGQKEEYELAYYAEEGKFYYASCWYDDFTCVEYRIEDGKLLWTENGATESLTRYKAPGEADDRFNADLCRPLFGTWSTSYVVDGESELGFEVPGQSLDYTAYMEFTFREDGTYLMKGSFEEESLMRVLRLYTIESIYTSYAEMGYDRAATDTIILQNFGVSVEEYVDAALAETSIDDYNQEIVGVYYVENGKLYDAESWDADMDISSFTVEGNTLILVDDEDGITLEFTRQ